MPVAFAYLPLVPAAALLAWLIPGIASVSPWLLRPQPAIEPSDSGHCATGPIFAAWLYSLGSACVCCGVAIAARRLWKWRTVRKGDNAVHTSLHTPPVRLAYGSAA